MTTITLYTIHLLHTHTLRLDYEHARFGRLWVDVYLSVLKLRVINAKISFLCIMRWCARYFWEDILARIEICANCSDMSILMILFIIEGVQSALLNSR